MSGHDGSFADIMFILHWLETTAQVGTVGDWSLACFDVAMYSRGRDEQDAERWTALQGCEATQTGAMNLR